MVSAVVAVPMVGIAVVSVGHGRGSGRGIRLIPGRQAPAPAAPVAHTAAVGRPVTVVGHPVMVMTHGNGTVLHWADHAQHNAVIPLVLVHPGLGAALHTAVGGRGGGQIADGLAERPGGILHVRIIVRHKFGYFVFPLPYGIADGKLAVARQDF